MMLDDALLGEVAKYLKETEPKTEPKTDQGRT